ncbi:GrpB family protein [Wukongibacter sp. M2B1]|uniref:GrpB family protein n=1 Tax=Wukongibacter sp. M2B1 TaxID=3088895 RepID=UPI003D7A6AE0
MGEQKKIRIIEVVPYNLQWVEKYQEEEKKISNIMPNEIVEIHHIGSTSIPNIYAKPVIDILIGVKDIEKVDKYNKEMEKLGYIAKGEHGILRRRFFLKGIYNRTHHVHIFQTEDLEIKRHLNFRDYMIAHPDEARNYEKLKRELAKEFRYDNEGYCNGKNSFIKDIDRKAEEWIKTNKQKQL